MSDVIEEVKGPSGLAISYYAGPNGVMYQLTNIRKGVHEYLLISPQEAFDMSRVFLRIAKNLE